MALRDHEGNDAMKEQPASILPDHKTFVHQLDTTSTIDEKLLRDVQERILKAFTYPTLGPRYDEKGDLIVTFRPLE